MWFFTILHILGNIYNIWWENYNKFHLQQKNLLGCCIVFWENSNNGSQNQARKLLSVIRRYLQGTFEGTKYICYEGTFVVYNKITSSYIKFTTCRLPSKVLSFIYYLISRRDMILPIHPYMCDGKLRNTQTICSVLNII